MKRFLPFLLLLIVSCKGDMEKLVDKIDLRGRTFVLNPTNDKGILTIQFMDSTCNIFEVHEFNQPWRLVNFENSNTLVLGRLIIALHQLNDSTITGLNIGEKETKLILNEKRPKWKLDKILGKWTEEIWVGIENSKIPPPPPAIPEHDTIWPPYYEIYKNKIISYCLGIDSTETQLDNSLVYFNMKKKLHTDFVGYQNSWKILDVSDSVLTIERRYTKKTFDAHTSHYLDSIETVRLIKKR